MRKKRTHSPETRMKMSLRAKERYAKKEPNSLSAAAVAPATEISFVKSSVLARKEAARQTIDDCDALLTAWDRLGL